MSNKPKIGQGMAMAALRQGGKELGQALKALPDSIAIVEEPGQMLNATPAEVSQQTGHSQMVDGPKLGPGSVLGQAMESIHQTPEIHSPELEMDR